MSEQSQSTAGAPIALVIHGGAGTITDERLSDELEAAFRESLRKALNAGYSVLEKGGTSLDAVEATVRMLEDDSLFNAGKGSVYNADGKNELDASIMDGQTLKAGAVAGVHHIKNPVTAARAVMMNSPHVMMIGEGAELFARKQGIEMVEPSYFHNEERFRQFEEMRRQEEEQGFMPKPQPEDWKMGTVGAVALDKHGNLAAATSTGGMTYKRYGRVGDSPIIGAGTYADNSSCAISCTGHGEYYIRTAAAFNIHALVKYKGYSVEKAAKDVIHDQIGKLGGTGGMIVLDRNGNYTMPFNTPGMFRGWRTSNGDTGVAMYGDEK